MNNLTGKIKGRGEFQREGTTCTKERGRGKHGSEEML